MWHLLCARRGSEGRWLCARGEGRGRWSLLWNIRLNCLNQSVALGKDFFFFFFPLAADRVQSNITQPLPNPLG